MPSSDDAIRKMLRPDTRLSDLCRHVSGKTSKSPVKRTAVEAPRTRKPKLPTYQAAREALLGSFLAAGWDLSSPHLKVPHATSEDGQIRFWLKPQAVWVSRGDRHTIGGARSTGIDMRQPRAFEKLLAYSKPKKRTAPDPKKQAALPYAGRDPGEPGPFSRTVLRALKSVPASGRFGPQKVFIGDAFKAYKRHGGTVSDLFEFKRVLGHANQRGELRLMRADLVGAMDPKKVSESEMRYMNAEFHFIIDPSK